MCRVHAASIGKGGVEKPRSHAACMRRISGWFFCAVNTAYAVNNYWILWYLILWYLMYL